jgi:hypothetical protein
MEYRNKILEELHIDKTDMRALRCGIHSKIIKEKNSKIVVIRKKIWENSNVINRVVLCDLEDICLKRG